MTGYLRLFGLTKAAKIPQTLRASILDVKGAHDLRDEDVARNIGVSRPQYVNAMCRRYGLSSDPAARLVHFAMAT